MKLRTIGKTLTLGLLLAMMVLPLFSSNLALAQPQNNANNNDFEIPEVQGDIQTNYADATAYNLQNVLNIIGEIRNFILIVGIIIILIFIVWGGIDYATARGDETKIGGAKSKIVGAIIGAAIILSTFAILETIKTIIQNRSLTT